jgi:hypothetical protein
MWALLSGQNESRPVRILFLNIAFSNAFFIAFKKYENGFTELHLIHAGDGTGYKPKSFICIVHEGPSIF